MLPLATQLTQSLIEQTSQVQQILHLARREVNSYLRDTSWLIRVMQDLAIHSCVLGLCHVYTVEDCEVTAYTKHDAMSSHHPILDTCKDAMSLEMNCSGKLCMPLRQQARHVIEAWPQLYISLYEF